MIHILNIRECRISDYDEVWAIVINLKNNYGRYKQVSELAPTQGLYSWYWNEKQHLRWGKEEFDNDYLPRFIKELSKEGEMRLKELKSLDEEGKNIALLCFCENEALCHRSIIAGILQGMGVNVRTQTGNDYSRYYEMYKAEHKQKELSVREKWALRRKTAERE